MQSNYLVRQLEKGYELRRYDDNKREIGTISVDNYDTIVDLLSAFKRQRVDFRFDLANAKRTDELEKLVALLLNS